MSIENDKLPEKTPGNVFAMCDDCADYHRELFKKSGAVPEIGDEVKVFLREDNQVEHMWLEVLQKDKESFVGKLLNYPTILQHLSFGQEISFTPDAIMLYTSKNWPDGKKFEYILETMKEVQNRHLKDHGAKST